MNRAYVIYQILRLAEQFQYIQCALRVKPPYICIMKLKIQREMLCILNKIY
ncbi:hypothetical protein RchiOBHm_Chr5g0022251 [Rosa chinensis]|uniref:Uncharacterized protein n=1 Tax=Rosa chinensis TaxID=74649 RepID=A0A2P6Q7R8_ROSCH|nr:hypothetical protein RchiOBHm_Chr5g0022251 [Rosa chinensis]